MGVRMLCALVVSVVAAGVGAGSAYAGTVSSQQLGINVSHNQWPADLTGGWPGSAGVGVARVEVIEGSSWSATDTLVTKLAEAGLRLAPFLGLACGSGCTGPQWSPPASTAASEMASYVTAFAQRYGPGGSFWRANPSLPQLPVEQYEIGDESNIPVMWVQDDTHLHWNTTTGDPCNSTNASWASDYAQVYVKSQQALQNLHLPGVQTVVGGLGDSGSLCVTLTQDEAMLSAIKAQAGPPDAVAFHPYTWQTDNNFAAMQSDVALLRQWMSANGMASTPIEINEFDACATTGQGCSTQNVVTSDWWGAFVSSYTTWALCTPGLNVGSVDPFTWGDTSETTNFQLLVDSSGTITSYGKDYLNTVKTLETTGCPPPGSIPPVLPPGSTGGPSGSPPGPVVGLPTARLHILRIHVHGSYVTVEIQVSYGNHSVKVVAVKGHHRIRFHVIRRRHWRTLLWLTAKLFHGKWTLNVTCVPPSGHATPPARHHTVKITR